MLGLAQRLFQEKQGLQANTPVSRWPLLQKMLDAKALDIADVSLAQLLLREIPYASEEHAALICHLSLSARRGHLCVIADENAVFPDPALLWKLDADTESVRDEEYEAIGERIQRGVAHFPKELLHEALEDAFPSAPICREGSRYYLQRYWLTESQFLNCYKERLQSVPKSLPQESDLLAKLEQTALTEEQKAAVLNCCGRSFSIICGGPGTGKTHTAGQLMRILLETLPEGTEAALAAPTGKAAANLEKSLQNALPGVSLQAKTLHSLLGIRSRKSWQKKPVKLSADLLLVDESSMIDVQMMARLFASLRPQARLILLGDPHQLPPVEAGAIFSDLVQSLQKQSDPRVRELTRCLRTESRSIVEFAEGVKSGNPELTMDLLRKGGQEVSYRPLASAKEVLALAENRYPSPDEDPRSAWETWFRFRILSPLRKGPFGVDSLNEKLYRHLSSQAKGALFAAPIMLVANDYRLGLFNGETGMLIRRGKWENPYLFGESDTVLFPDREGGYRVFSASVAPKFEYAYCMSVHKSQGSEFDEVLLLLPEGSENFGREVFYTGITRARKQLEIWGEEQVIRETVERKSERLSGLSS